VDDIALRYSPESIILFGSRARGTAVPSSDADLLVVMDHPNSNADFAAEILISLDPAFPVDLLVRKPADVAKRLAMNDLFMNEIIQHGTVVYEGHRS
jgi:predicted nucleotidyltransferase